MTSASWRPPPVDLDAAVERLAAAIRIPAVSRAGEPPPVDALRGLHAHLEAAFPRAHAALKRETVNGLSLLYEWPGSERAGLPLLLLAHLDVVPVEPDTEGRWSHPPFSGAVADGFVWGRGAIDDKGRLFAIFEAVEALLEEGIRPRLPVLIGIGHDEEVGGSDGARGIAALLAERGVRPLFVIDEGSAVLDGIVPGVDRPVAVVGLAEKGYVSVELVAHGAEGHASMPPKETAAVVLARALDRLAARPFPAKVDGPARKFFGVVGREMGLARRLAFANPWLTGPALRRALERHPGTNALLRTTVAPTMLSGSGKDNVLPAAARAVVNLRIHPRDSIDGALARLSETIADDRVEVREYGGFRSEPSPVSPDDGPAWEALTRSIRETFPDAIVAPSLVVVATDSRHYGRLTDRVYRFAPNRFGPDDLARIHGTDERLGVEDYGRMIEFYARLIRNAAG